MLSVISLLAVSAVSLTAEKRAALRAQLAADGHFIADSDEALRAFLSPVSIKAGRGNNPIPVLNASEAIDPSVIWQIGKEAWQLVQDNQPEQNVSSLWAGAVPKGITSWTTLENWQKYQSEEYYISFVNAVGIKLTEFRWVFEFKYAGDYNGTGKYVTQAGAAVNKAYAYLSEHLDVAVTALKPLNYGSQASPMAGIDIAIKLTSHGSFESTTVGCQVTMKGDGSLTEVTCDKGKHKC